MLGTICVSAAMNSKRRKNSRITFYPLTANAKDRLGVFFSYVVANLNELASQRLCKIILRPYLGRIVIEA
jgi:hypothetical protein